jgi:nucleoside-diphosphate-sugar epimerase
MASRHDSRETVLVVGAGEYMATRLISALALHSSYRPIPLVEGAAHAVWTDLEVRHCNAANSAELTNALEGVDLVVNCVAGKPGTILATTKALCDAARRSPPRRIAHISSMAVYGGASGLVDETTRPEPPLNPYARARIECEAVMRQYVADGGDAVIIRPSCIFGPGSEPWAGRIARLLLSRRLGDLGALGDGLCNLVQVDDLVAIMIATFSAPDVVGETFNATADWPRPTWNDFLIRFARAIGATPVERISERKMQVEVKLLAPLLRGAALVAGPVGAGRFVPDAMTPSFVRTLRQRITVSADKTSAMLGTAHMPLDQAIDETARWWNSRQSGATPTVGDRPAESVR